MDNFKFNFLSRGQLESLNLDRIFLPLFKIIITMLRGFFGNLIFAIIARMLCGNYLNIIHIKFNRFVITCSIVSKKHKHQMTLA